MPLTKLAIKFFKGSCPPRVHIIEATLNGTNCIFLLFIRGVITLPVIENVLQ